MINNLISGVLIENTPLDGGDTTEYRNFLHQLLSIRTQTLSLLTQPLHQFFQNRKVACYFWFDPSTEYPMYHHPSQSSSGSGSSNDHQQHQTPNFLNSVYEKTSTWNVNHDKINAEMKDQHVNIHIYIYRKIRKKRESNNRVIHLFIYLLFYAIVCMTDRSY